MATQYLVAAPLKSLFTDPKKFRSIFFGSIYVGLVDQNPLNPSNQQQVYVVNESGDKVPVSQPVKIGPGGYAEYNGSPAKFVCDEPYSITVLNKIGSGVWYAPDIRDIDLMNVTVDDIPGHEYYQRQATVGEVESGKFSPGDYLVLSDRLDAKVKIEAAGWPQAVDGFGVLDAGNGNVAVIQQVESVALVDHYGAKSGDLRFDSLPAVQYCLRNFRSVTFMNDQYKIDGRLFFLSGCDIDLNGASLYGNSSDPMFESGYLNNGSLETTYGLPLGNFASRHFFSKIYNGKVYGSSVIFKMQQILLGCRFQDVTGYDVGKAIDLVEGYYSSYKNISMLFKDGSPDFVSRNISTNAGSGVVTVSDPSGIVVGSYVLCHSLPKGFSVVTQINGNTLTLNNLATKTVAQGALYSGAVFSKAAAKPAPGFSFKTACSQLNIQDCSSSSRMIGFYLESVTSSHFDVVDSEGVGIAFEIGPSVQAIFTAPYLEGVRYAAFAGLNNNLSSDLTVSGLHSGTGAGIAAMAVDGINGGLTMRMDLNYGNIGGYTPYGFDQGNSKPIFDITNVSSNVSVDITVPEGAGGFASSLVADINNRLKITEIRPSGIRHNTFGTPSCQCREYIGYQNDDTVSPVTNYFNSQPRVTVDVVAGGISCSHKEFFDHIPKSSGFVRLVKKYTNASVSDTEVHIGLSEANSTSSEAITRWFYQKDGFKPFADNAYTIGDATHRPSQIFSATGTISTSDETMKTAILPPDESEKAAAIEIKSAIGKYKMLESIAEKGEGSARVHWGVGAQTVKDILEKHGINPDSQSFFCRDEWHEIDGVEVKPDIDGSYPEGSVKKERYGIRYSQLCMFILVSM